MKEKTWYDIVWFRNYIIRALIRISELWVQIFENGPKIWQLSAFEWNMLKFRVNLWLQILLIKDDKKHKNFVIA